ncbi:unnamed protein product [Gulo gulo]|uniref:Uncharacterized protein n=1 Tax=Gulo gulo TaxID=48420 RepID=A0A9X9M8N6_GULGU|nr:unnamed protein product [Gulo gulo]
MTFFFFFVEKYTILKTLPGSLPLLITFLVSMEIVSHSFPRCHYQQQLLSQRLSCFRGEPVSCLKMATDYIKHSVAARHSSVHLTRIKPLRSALLTAQDIWNFLAIFFYGVKV